MKLPFLLGAVLASASLAGADHCSTWSTTTPDVTIGAGIGPTYYVDHVTPPLPCCILGDLWIYEESNGLAGLQHEDESIDDTCHGLIDGDTIIF